MKLFFVTLLAALSLRAEGGKSKKGDKCDCETEKEFQRLCNAYVRQSDIIAEETDNIPDALAFFDANVAPLQDEDMTFMIDLGAGPMTLIGTANIRGAFASVFGGRTFQFTQLSDFEVTCADDMVEVMSRYHGVIKEGDDANYKDIFGEITCIYDDDKDEQIDIIDVVRTKTIDRGYGATMTT